MNLGLENVERGHLSLLTLKQEKKQIKYRNTLCLDPSGLFME